MTAYRDDLEAAQLRASDLEREMKELRTRTAELERQRFEMVRRQLEARALQKSAPRTLDGRPVMLLASWIAAVAGAAYIHAVWAGVLVSVVVLVIMALAPSSSNESEDRE